MSDLDGTDYGNGVKNNWRRTVWNVVREWTPSTRDALTLYLPGSTNLDTVIGGRKGFRPANFIAVERNKKVAKFLRKQGTTTIEGSLLDVLMAWPTDPPVSVVMADFCGGFHKEAMAIFQPWLFFPAFKRSLLVLNVCRGRETTDLSKMIRGADRAELARSAAVPELHRGLAAVTWLISFYCAIRSWETGIDPTVFARALDRRGALPWEGRIIPGYRSPASAGNLYFDTVIFRDLGVDYRPTKMVEGEYADARGFGGWKPTVSEFEAIMQAHRAMRRKIAAALAIRTRRLRGELDAGRRVVH